MSRRQQTTATFAIRIQLPASVTASMMQQYIVDSLNGWKGGMSPSEFDTLQVNAVTLTKRETTYGNS